jgi:hypothetical protein
MTSCDLCSADIGVDVLIVPTNDYRAGFVDSQHYDVDWRLCMTCAMLLANDDRGPLVVRIARRCVRTLGTEHKKRIWTLTPMLLDGFLGTVVGRARRPRPGVDELPDRPCARMLGLMRIVLARDEAEPPPTH